MGKASLRFSGNTVGLFVIFCLVYPFFFFGDSDGQPSRLFSELWNLGHFFFFSVFAVFFDGSLRVWNFSRKVRFCLAVIVVCFVGFAIELVQLHIGGRFFSLNDLLKDILGCCFSLFIIFSSSVTRKWAALLRTVAIMLLVVAFVPFGEIAYDQYCMYRDFPLLGGFERWGELSRWEGNAGLSRDSSIFRSGGFSGKVVLTDAQYSGVSLRYLPGDWSGYYGLSFSVFNPGEPVRLSFRVHDDLHSENPVYSNRYNGSLLLRKGWNVISIPMEDIVHGPVNRLMDITAIKGFGIFITEKKRGRQLYLDDVKLFKKLEQ